MSSTNLLIKNFEILKLRIDFMGYPFEYVRELSYHHAFTFRRDGGKKDYPNGVILVRDTSHDYIHIIEKYNLDIFKYITSELALQKGVGYIDFDCLKRIHQGLKCFERIYDGKKDEKGFFIIKPEYKKRILIK